MSARRSLLTTAAAGALLGALCFVPSANATAPPADAPPQASSHASHTPPARDDHFTTTAASGHLAETGGFDSTPYVIGGSAFLSLGAGFVVFSVRRERGASGGAGRGAAY
ncbi:LAETG motif-containing sortase-dependent surface protein [Streptomyces sp. NPDC005562]|uniref:LAETG motif-containing sortase-dependent surface protein n=1 Tax=unclassified Streptomyces TaxID=2593676 RepID=UPI0033B968DC